MFKGTLQLFDVDNNSLCAGSIYPGSTGFPACRRWRSRRDDTHTSTERSRRIKNNETSGAPSREAFYTPCPFYRVIALVIGLALFSADEATTWCALLY